MVKKLHPRKPATAAGAILSSSVKDSAQQIWQVGLGAFNRAQAEGNKAFESLVKEGTAIQRKTQAVAEEKISEASQKMSSMATDITSKATGQWDKLENIFEERVAKALNKLGVPSAKDVNALIDRINALHKAVQKLSSQPAVAPKAATAKKPAPAKKTAKAKASTKTTAPKAKAVAKKVASKRAPAKTPVAPAVTSSQH